MVVAWLKPLTLGWWDQCSTTMLPLASQFSLFYSFITQSMGIAHNEHLCRKNTILRCHRYLIFGNFEDTKNIEMQFWPPDIVENCYSTYCLPFNRRKNVKICQKNSRQFWLNFSFTCQRFNGTSWKRNEITNVCTASLLIEIVLFTLTSMN
jgi:hypothetical protein